MFRADLHCHTTCSDGSLTPQQLLRDAKERGLSGLSITDHDTVAAYATAQPLARELGLLLGTGVEFSSLFREMSVHILGYDFDLKHSAILALCERHQTRRLARNRSILRKLAQRRMPISEEELGAQGEGSKGRLHIANLMLKKGYVKTLKEAFDLYIGDGKPCFDPGAPISSEETLAIIHEAGGKAFVAHPHLLRHQSRIRELFKLPFDGMECYCGRSQPKQEERFLRLCKERGWLVSGGSDFHGNAREYAFLGSAWVDEARFLQIFSCNLNRYESLSSAS